jgi:hypothetical protein
VKAPRSRHFVEAFLLEVAEDVARQFWGRVNPQSDVYEYKWASWAFAICGVIAWLVLLIGKADGRAPMIPYSYRLFAIGLIPAGVMSLISISKAVGDWFRDVKERAVSRAERWKK